MAARENQGYLIAIILLVLLTVILAILTYFAFSQAGAKTSNADQLEKDLATSNSRLAAYEEQSAILKAYIGVGGVSVNEVPQRLKNLESSRVDDVLKETQDIQAAFMTDMSRYTRATGENVEKNYRGLANDLNSTAISKSREITQLHGSVELAEDEKLIELATKDKELETVRVQLDKARKDYQEEVSRHTNTKETLEKELVKAKAENIKKNQEFEQATEDWNIERTGLVQERVDLKEKVDDLEARLKKYESKRYDIADGSVLRVAHSIDKVYVDLGSADRLQVRQSFVIFDQSLDTFERGGEKAKIEITKILGPRSSEARIISQDNINPILTGDHVLTPTWDPGYAVPVVLAGRFDLDGDGNSDIERLISLIRLNNGRVIAYHDDAGEVYGEVTKDARFIVLGDSSNASTKIMNEAKKFEIQPIAVIEYLNSMGIRLDSRVTEGTGSLGSFPKRQPPANNGTSAFEDE